MSTHQSQVPTLVNDDLLCQWFALCDHVARQTIFHPVLGDVLICDRCLARFLQNS